MQQFKFPACVYVRWTQTPEGWMSRKAAKRKGHVPTKKQRARLKKVGKK